MSRGIEKNLSSPHVQRHFAYQTLRYTRRFGTLFQEEDYSNEEALCRLVTLLEKQGKYAEAFIIAGSIQDRLQDDGNNDEERRKLTKPTQAVL